MKFKLAAMVDIDRVIGIYLETPHGVYSASLVRKHICFEENLELSELFVPPVNMVSTFSEEDLIPKEGCDGVLCYPCGTKEIGIINKTDIVMEYLDTSNGKIPRHSHPEGVMEIYFSADMPDRAEICGYGGFHEPFCDHTIAVKLINKRLAHL